MSKKALNFNYFTYLFEKCHEQISDGFQQVNDCYWQLIFKRDYKKVWVFLGFFGGFFFLVISNSTKKRDLPSVKKDHIRLGDFIFFVHVWKEISGNLELYSHTLSRNSGGSRYIKALRVNMHLNTFPLVDYIFLFSHVKMYSNISFLFSLFSFLSFPLSFSR